MLVVSSIPNFKVPGADEIFGLDKLAHLSEYFILAFLVFKVRSNYKYSTPIRLCIILFFAIIDELHQKLIPGRTAEFFDFAADTIGSLCGFLVLQNRLSKSGQV